MIKIDRFWVEYSDRELVVLPSELNADNETVQVISRWVGAVFPGISRPDPRESCIYFWTHNSQLIERLHRLFGDEQLLVREFERLRGNNVRRISPGPLPSTLLIEVKFYPSQIHVDHLTKLLRDTCGRMSNAVIADYPVYGGAAVEAYLATSSPIENPVSPIDNLTDPVTRRIILSAFTLELPAQLPPRG